ncbi:MAG: nucleotide exchange factor GrpE [Ruminococcus sp.]|nr:nucleotide exchange factor GrpE [Ruminococcus sp.]
MQSEDMEIADMEAAAEEAELEAVLEDESVSETDQLKAEIEKLRREVSDAKDNYLRTAAEYDNFRKRSTKDRLAAIANTKSADAAEILSVTDNFSRALGAECSDANYKKGIEMIAKQFENVISNLGIKEIEAVGKPFDPKVHNAIGQREDENFPENTVCEVLQKGYCYEDKVIRPAMVVVANP